LPVQFEPYPGMGKITRKVIRPSREPLVRLQVVVIVAFILLIYESPSCLRHCDGFRSQSPLPSSLFFVRLLTDRSASTREAGSPCTAESN